MLASGLLGLTLSLVWAGAAALGWGWAGRLAFEVVFHAALARSVVPPLNRALASYLKPFVQDELLALAEDELTASP